MLEGSENENDDGDDDDDGDEVDDGGGDANADQKKLFFHEREKKNVFQQFSNLPKRRN